jgi:hypothetical protein
MPGAMERFKKKRGYYKQAVNNIQGLYYQPHYDAVAKFEAVLLDVKPGEIVDFVRRSWWQKILNFLRGIF